MNITILGNGPSRDEWDGVGDIVIGCHWGDGVDYLCTNHPNHGWQPIPTIIGLTRQPDVEPHTPISEARFNWKDGRVARIEVSGLLVALPRGRYWDTGTVAVLWALHTYPKDDIYLWGFDSLWSDEYINPTYPNHGNVTSGSSKWKGHKQWMLRHPRIRVCGQPKDSKLDNR